MPEIPPNGTPGMPTGPLGETSGVAPRAGVRALAPGSDEAIWPSAGADAAQPCGIDSAPNGAACPIPADTAAAPRPGSPADPSAAVLEPSPAASPDTFDVNPLAAICGNR